MEELHVHQHLFWFLEIEPYTFYFSHHTNLHGKVCTSNVNHNIHIRPIYIGKNQILIKKNLVFFVVPFTLPEKPIKFGVFGMNSACAKTPESHTCVLVSGAHARLLSTFDRTRVRITSRAVVGWFRWRSRTTWPKTRIIPARLERAFTLAKNQWNFGGVSKNHAAEVGFSIQVFFSVRGSCLATLNEKPECEKDSGFFMPV